MARSVMSHQFSRVPSVETPRSSFDRSHGYKSTFDAGWLIPVLVDEILPGDSYNVKMTAFARLATPIHPLMDNLFLDSFFFFVPTRLVWDNWEKFNGAQDDPGDSTSFVVPRQSSSGDYAESTVGDYFGMPIDTSNLEPNTLPFRCHNLIYNEWFRDQNLQDSVTVPKDDGPDAKTTFTLKRRCKRHDYFTSCLPWPQKGDIPAINLGGSIPVIPSAVGAAPVFEDAPTGTRQNALEFLSGSNTAKFTGAETKTGTAVWSQPALKVDMSEVDSIAINTLREAFQVQKLLERDARGGTRYTEIIRSHFGVVSPDSRLQRSEYLGGGSTPINITPVPQTSSTDATTPQGNLSAYGTAGINNHGFTKSFTEHGYLIGFVNVRADVTYQQGIERMWNRTTRYDFYWPSFAHLGEQAVESREIFADGTGDDDLVFGYQERSAEYRYKPSKITGDFRSAAAASLDAWHLSQEFSPRPTLNEAFIVENPPVDRVIAVPAEPHLLFDAYFSMRCARPMPMYGVPGLIDHF